MKCPPSSYILEHFKDQVQQLASKCRPFREPEEISHVVQIKKKAVHNLVDSYLIFDSKEEKEWDKWDKMFVGQVTPFKKIYQLHGLHSYGGYRLFFRPDLSEVFWLMIQEIPKKDLDDCQVFYVTTHPYPSSYIASCYDSENDRHRAVTYCYLTFKEDNISK